MKNSLSLALIAACAMPFALHAAAGEGKMTTPGSFSPPFTKTTVGRTTILTFNTAGVTSLFYQQQLQKIEADGAKLQRQKEAAQRQLDEKNLELMEMQILNGQVIDLKAYLDLAHKLGKNSIYTTMAPKGSPGIEDSAIFSPVALGLDQFRSEQEAALRFAGSGIPPSTPVREAFTAPPGEVPLAERIVPNPDIPSWQIGREDH